MAITEQDTRKSVAEHTVTKIHGQPTLQDIDVLDDELTAIASSFPSELGGGMHGHAGLIKTAADSLCQQTQAITQPDPSRQHSARSESMSTRH